MKSRIGMKNRARLELETLEERDTPSSLTLSIGDGVYASADLTMETGPGASGSIVGHAAPQSGVTGTIFLDTANK